MNWHAHIDHVDSRRGKYLVRVTRSNDDGTNGDELTRFEVDSGLRGRALREHCEALATEKVAKLES